MTPSRTLTCTRCANHIHVFEQPAPFIDPQRYVCHWCLKDKTPTLLDHPLQEQRRHDPAIAALPEGF